MCVNLRDHPFAVEAFFDYSTVLSFAVPAAELQQLLPACLQPDTFNDQWGFIAVAMVQTRQLRPKGFPSVLGQDFFLTGFRIFVRYTSQAGKRLRGLYILRSETDKKKMELLGSIFTRYRYHTTDIHINQENGLQHFLSRHSSMDILVQTDSDKEIALPGQSPFSDWAQARRFAGPLPFTFSWNETTRKVLIVEGVRTSWQPAPIIVMHQHIGFLQSLNLKGMTLASAFIVRNIPYYWKKGKTERWTG